MIGLIRLYLKNIYKTLYFNFEFLPFKQAIKLPIIVNRHVVIKKSKGKVIINQNSNKKIWIGFPCLNDTSIKTDETIIFIDGIMEFKGEAFIANGMRIDVKSNGKLILGDLDFCRFSLYTLYIIHPIIQRSVYIYAASQGFQE